MINGLSILANQKTINNITSKTDLPVVSEAIDHLISEGGKDFYNYVNRIGLVTDPKLIVLSSHHGYFYDNDEMKNANTIVNLKELNQIKQLKTLLFSHLHFLPDRCNYIGCFINNQKNERYGLRTTTDLMGSIKNSVELELGIVSQYPIVNRIYSMMDLKTNLYMSEKSVTLMLKAFGFKMIDMTDSAGLTYFHSQKIEGIYN